MPATITIPKKALENVFRAGRRFLAAENIIEDALLASESAFIKKMRRLRNEHLRGSAGEWHTLKERHGL